MNISDFLKKNSVVIETGNVKQWSTVVVSFERDDNTTDEVSFDIESVLTSAGIKDLNELFSDFCKEDAVFKPVVNGVTVVRTANTYDELMELEAEEEGYCFREE